MKSFIITQKQLERIIYGSSSYTDSGHVIVDGGIVVLDEFKTQSMSNSVKRKFTELEEASATSVKHLEAKIKELEKASKDMWKLAEAHPELGYEAIKLDNELADAKRGIIDGVEIYHDNAYGRPTRSTVGLASLKGEIEDLKFRVTLLEEKDAR